MTSETTIYGAQMNAEELELFLQHTFAVNRRAEQSGQKRTPVCIWGRHGIGKTEFVEQFARDHHYQYRYLAPAQLEEMGDLLGMPTIRDGLTHFSPPAWVPVDEGPGILLIDDVNRADSRILRGIMQLLQQFRIISWSLPSAWQIVLTANPDTGNYVVTPLDNAMLTRMTHVTLKFDPGTWGSWALQRKIDGRFVQFVLTFPQLIKEGQCTPRTLVRFYDNIASMEDWAVHLPLVRNLGYGTIGPEATETFLGFVRQQMHQIPTPEQILNTKAFASEIESPLKRLVKQEVLRVDLLAALQTRLVSQVNDQEQPLRPLHLDNLKSYLKIDWIPEDLKFALVQDLAKLRRKPIHKVLEDPEIGHLLLNTL